MGATILTSRQYSMADSMVKSLSNQGTSMSYM